MQLLMIWLALSVVFGLAFGQFARMGMGESGKAINPGKEGKVHSEQNADRDKRSAQ